MDEEDDAFVPNRRGNPKPKKRTTPLTEKELKSLLSDETDVSNVLLRIARQDGSLERLLREMPLSAEKLSLIMKVLAKAVDNTNNTQAQLQAVIEVLQTFMYVEEFHDQIVNSFQSSLRSQAAYIRAVATVLKCTIEKFQTTAPKFLSHVFLPLNEVIESRFEDDEELNDDKNVIRRLLVQQRQRNDNEEKAERVFIDDDHDVDPNLFRELSIIPTAADFDPGEDIEYRANKVKGVYENINDYLDIQFRLLRADLILPLRQNIMKYLHGGDQKNFRGMQVYSQVRIVRPICHDKGLCFRLSFDVSNLRKINWAVSQRLKYGSLLCLSVDNFNTYQCAVVENRDPKDLAKGLVDVQFVLNDHVQNAQMGRHEEFMRLISEGRDLRYVMVESPTYFEAYKYVLLGLQNFTENNFPFWRYIGQCHPQIDPPEYLQNGNSTFDLRPLVDSNFIIKDNQVDEDKFSDASRVAKTVDILNLDSWPHPNRFSLDNSQFLALQAALTKEFSIIQGPPGTGKTFIGLLVMKTLLHNKQIWLGDRERSPMLLVCYTNHALDQFLEGILNFYQGSLVRVGSRSKSERLEEFNLRGMRNRARENRTVPLEVHLAKQETRLKMKEMKAEIHTEAAKLEILEREIVKENFLKPVVQEVHYKTLRRLSGNESVILKWLGVSEDVTKLDDIKNQKKQKPANQDQERNAFRHAARGAEAAGQEQIDSEEDEEDDEDLLEMLNTDLPQTRHLDIDDDDDVDEAEDEDNGLFSELFENLGEGFIENVRHVNKKLDEADIESERIRSQNVAFNISSYGEEPPPVGLSKDEKKQWNSIIPIKKRYRAILLGHLQKVDKMTEDEASQVYDVWKLRRHDRWRLYRYWIDLYCRQIRGEIRVKTEQYEQSARRYQEILLQEDKAILEKATIIGMTTTGAARYQGILREIGPRIVLVEEAAEVFEGHVITCLTDQCQHVVLIGDHKQLRPNPSVYKLKTDCGLDISLFERLVDNEFPYTSLKYQHRMRPEISKLLRLPDLYPDLKDHDEVERYPDVLRVNGNVCFIQHGEHDSQEHDTSTFTNKFEAEFIIGLCEYILLQGQFKAEQITILSPYAGQIHFIKNQMQSLAKSHKTADKLKGVKISSVDNYQGNENDIILLSLVRSNEDNEIGFLKANNRICVALSRAKIGLYVFGNFAGLAQSSPLIQEISNKAKGLGYLKDCITLSCLKHKEKPTTIRQPKDFNKVSEGGCSQPCEMRLKCGHSCKRVCHADDLDHKNSQCNERCKHLCEKCQQYCKDGHRCGEHEVCRNLVVKRIPICNHVQKVPCGVEPNGFECKEKCQEVLPCGHQCEEQCGSKHTHSQNMCKVKMQIAADQCGHGSFYVVCGQSRSQDRSKCPQPCNTELACGHLCAGSCGECSNGRLHVTCQKKCQKILICGHECQDTCSSCPPCTRPCETACTHSRCPKKCGEPCANCVEDCTWTCKHHTCKELCCLPCQRPPCDVQCPKRLRCGHLCSGLCGEKCPRLCSICDQTTLMNESLYGYDGDPTTLFIEVDCGHVIEVDFMDQWMKTCTSNESGNLVIGLITCPVCKSPVRKCSRYNKQIKEMLRLVENVKKKYIGEKHVEMKKRLVKVISEIRGQDRQIIDRFIQEGGEVLSEVILEAQLNQVNLFRLITAMRKATEECIRRFDAGSGTFRTILLDLESFCSWILKKRAIFSEQNRMDAELEKDRLTVLLDLCKINETVKQRGLHDRLETRHVTMLGQTVRKLSAHKRADPDGVQAAKALCEKLKEIIPDTYIALTATEKLEIVRAVNVSRGAWYKCRNGHIYAIGECGQAMEESVCPECKARIGGASHQLLADNAWAPDMDEAERPIWDNINADRELAMRLQEELERLDFMD